jgi:ABC-type sugar transport system ATPase subunit
LPTPNTVLKDGVRVKSGRICDITREELIEAMIGCDVQREFVKKNKRGHTPLLEAKGLTRAPRFADINFILREGEAPNQISWYLALCCELLQCNMAKFGD